MQAQATAGTGSGNLLQNPKFQIGLIVAGAIAVIVVIILLIPKGASGPPPSAPDLAAAAGGGNNPDAAPLGGGIGDDPTMLGGTGGTGGAVPGATAAGMPGATTPGAAGAAEGGVKKSQSPGVPVRRNPFQPNTELAKVIDSIRTFTQQENVASSHDLYAEIRPPKPAVQQDGGEDGGPPIPAMRVSGVVQGTSQITALLQIGSEFIQVTPGAMIPRDNPVYRVERIERDKVVLTRRWEQGEKKGTQRIEVSLAGNAPAAGAGVIGGPGGFPGMGARGAGGGAGASIE